MDQTFSRLFLLLQSGCRRGIERSRTIATMSKSPLLTIPAEILEHILKPLFSFPDAEICLGLDDKPRATVSYRPPLSILRTCKQLCDVGMRVLQSSIADCRLSLSITKPAAFTPHCVPFLKQYGKLFRSVHITQSISICFNIGQSFEHLTNIKDVEFSFCECCIGEDELSFNGEWLFLEDSELQKHLWQPRMLAIRETSAYVNKLPSAYPRTDELVVRVALCIIFQKCTDHRLVSNEPLCHRQLLTQHRISRSLGQKGSLCRNSGSNVNSLNKNIGICENRRGTIVC